MNNSTFPYSIFRSKSIVNVTVELSSFKDCTRLYHLVNFWWQIYSLIKHTLFILLFTHIENTIYFPVVSIETGKLNET